MQAKCLIASLLRHQPWTAKHSTTCACGWTAVLFIFKRARPTATKVTCDYKRPALLRTARSRDDIVLCAKCSIRFRAQNYSFVFCWHGRRFIEFLHLYRFSFFFLSYAVQQIAHVIQPRRFHGNDSHFLCDWRISPNILCVYVAWPVMYELSYSLVQYTFYEVLTFYKFAVNFCSSVEEWMIQENLWRPRNGIMTLLIVIRPLLKFFS